MPSIPWFDNLEAAFDKATATSRPLFIDFFAPG